MKKHKEIEAKLEVKAATIPVPGHPDAAPGLPDIAPAHNVTAPKHPVAPPKPKVKMSKKKKEKPTLPAPSCQYEQIRADRIALKNSFLKSLNEGETSNKPSGFLETHWLHMQLAIHTIQWNWVCRLRRYLMPLSSQSPLKQQQQPGTLLQQPQQQQTGVPQQQHPAGGQQTVVLNSSAQHYFAPKGGAVTGQM